MSRRVNIRPEAEADLARAFDWYEERRKGLGTEFLGEVQSVLDKVKHSPLRYPALYRDVRQALVRRFPYKVLYCAEREGVDVIAVVHVRRDPQFWRRRV